MLNMLVKKQGIKNSLGGNVIYDHLAITWKAVHDRRAADTGTEFNYCGSVIIPTTASASTAAAMSHRN
eukprot:11225176-Lingulodinium_polyedra.AAC.4